MSVSFEIRFFGWAFDEAKNNDKIWGWVEVEGKLYNFWGRRGDLDDTKRLKFKRNPSGWEGNHDLKRKTQQKMNPSGDKVPYRSIGLARNADGAYTDIEAVYPGFTAHFLKQLTWARLSATVKGEEIG